MFCTSCGKSMPEGNRFCTNCGTPIYTSNPIPAPVNNDIPTMPPQPIEDNPFAPPPVIVTPVNEIAEDPTPEPAPLPVFDVSGIDPHDITFTPTPMTELGVDAVTPSEKAEEEPAAPAPVAVEEPAPVVVEEAAPVVVEEPAPVVVEETPLVAEAASAVAYEYKVLKGDSIVNMEDILNEHGKDGWHVISIDYQMGAVIVLERQKA